MAKGKSSVTFARLRAELPPAIMAEKLTCLTVSELAREFGCCAATLHRYAKRELQPEQWGARKRRTKPPAPPRNVPIWRNGRCKLPLAAPWADGHESPCTNCIELQACQVRVAARLALPCERGGELG